ncbi:hypothetical protein DEA98_10395 [Brucella pseudogrignonensis]|nr:hypothetical protein [Brucella pseudogrignonensis]
MPVPKFSISANGVDITGRIAGSGVTMTITDGVGTKSDTMSIVISDVDGSVAAPKTGAILNPVGGYEGQMRDFGQFSVDSVVSPLAAADHDSGEIRCRQRACQATRSEGVPEEGLRNLRRYILGRGREGRSIPYDLR